MATSPNTSLSFASASQETLAVKPNNLGRTLLTVGLIGATIAAASATLAFAGPAVAGIVAPALKIGEALLSTQLIGTIGSSLREFLAEGTVGAGIKYAFDGAKNGVKAIKNALSSRATTEIEAAPITVPAQIILPAAAALTVGQTFRAAEKASLSAPARTPVTASVPGALPALPAPRRTVRPTNTRHPTINGAQRPIPQQRRGRALAAAC